MLNYLVMVDDISERSFWRHPSGGLTLVAALGVVAYAVWIFSGQYTPYLDSIISNLALALINLAIFTAGLTIFRQVDYGQPLRTSWLLLAAGSLAFILDGVFSALALGFPTLRLDASLVGLARAFYYPFTVTGLLLLSFVFIHRQERGVLWLDLGIIIAFIGILTWYFFLAAPSFAAESGFSRTWILALPVGDALILAGAFTLVLRELSRSARWILTLVMLAMVFALSGDIYYAYNELNMIAYSHALVSLMWIVSSLAELSAAARQIVSGTEILSEPQGRFSPFRQVFRLALPYLAIVFGLGLLAFLINTRLDPEPRLVGVLVGTYLLVTLVLLRQYVVLQDNIRLYQRMRRVAWTDSLTSLYNRHFFNEMLPREMERANRYNKQLAILLLDIDGFKQYNDTYGHLQGDAVLKAIARIFASQLRTSDTIARFGGDEFVVILPETNRRLGRSIANRISQAVKEQSEIEVKLGVSAGVAVFRPGMTPEQFIDEADQDLYKRKKQKKTARQASTPVPESTQYPSIAERSTSND